MKTKREREQDREREEREIGGVKRDRKKLDWGQETGGTKLLRLFLCARYKRQKEEVRQEGNDREWRDAREATQETSK